MGKRPETQSKQKKGMRPARDPDARNLQLASLAIDLAAKQLEEGTASSQVITHFLKVADSKYQVEREILECQKELIKAKTKSYEAAQSNQELYIKAVEAMKRYSGNGRSDPYKDEEPMY